MTMVDMWQRIQPALSHVGVTRVADITWLDEVGIPCWQAIRPNAKTLSVSQGKGMTAERARISAAMEAIEVWHAENVQPPDLVATLGEVGSSLGYPVTALRVRERSFLNPATRLEWTQARRIADGTATMVPTASLRLDSVVAPEWDLAPFEVTSNGLASGASRDEAILHGLCEVIERDAMAGDASLRASVDPATAPAVAAGLIDRFHAAGMEVSIWRADTLCEAPCFVVGVNGPDFPAEFRGSGADLDAAAALCQALTEAAQSRVAAIAGTREDLSPSLYREAAPAAAPDAGPLEAWSFSERRRLSVSADIALLTDRITRLTGHPPLVVDHTRADLGIPVVRVVCPGLRCPADY